MTNLYKYEFKDRRGKRIIKPSGEFNIKFTQERAKDDRFDYVYKMTGDLQFEGKDFLYLLELERSVYRSENNTLTITRLDGSINDVYVCRINFSDGDWHLDKCILKIQAQVIDQYADYDDIKGSEFNIFNLVADRHVGILLEAGVTYEFLEYTSAACNEDPLWGGGGTPAAGQWSYYYNYYKNNYNVGVPGYLCEKTTRWVREVKSIPVADPALAAPWVFISTDGANNKYARLASLYKITTTRDLHYNSGILYPAYYLFLDEWGIFGYSQAQPTIDNGMLLNDIMQAFCTMIGLTWRSDFLQAAPYNPSAINYVTGVNSVTDHIMVWQKSDVKRPAVSNNAYIYNTTFEKLIGEISMMFRGGWQIRAGVMRFEHVSFFTRNYGLDLTQARYVREVFFRREYTYIKEKLPHKEIFKNMDVSPTPSDFAPAYIFYDGNNATPGTEGETTYALDQITTDILFCLQNPDPDSKLVSDEGLVFGAMDKVGMDYYFIRASARTAGEVSKPNNVFGWLQLIYDYHFYLRPSLHGRILVDKVTFLSIDPSKKGVSFSIPYCPGDIFNPLDKIKTPFAWGDAIVNSSEYVPHSNQLTLSLLYDQEFNLTPNNPPNAGNFFIYVYKNLNGEAHVFFSPSFDDQGLDTAQGIEFEPLAAPLHGTAIVGVGNQTIIYTPAHDFVGTDELGFYIIDYWGERSNMGILSVQVINDPTYPVVGNVGYQVIENIALDQIAAGGILSASSDDQPGLVATAGTFATFYGGALTINVDGSFHYAPPVDFIGMDYYDFTITDSDGHTAIGRAYFQVKPNTIYVRLIMSNHRVDANSYTLCGSNPGGHRYISHEYDTYTLNFFSDAAGTIPVNVTGYGLQVNIHEINTYTFGPANPHDTLYPTGGSVQILFMDKETKFDDEGCGGIGVAHETTTIALTAGAGYTVI